MTCDRSVPGPHLSSRSQKDGLMLQPMDVSLLKASIVLGRMDTGVTRPLMSGQSAVFSSYIYLEEKNNHCVSQIT